MLCEKGEIAGEQSSRNWGWCRKMGRDPREIPLAIEALRLWPEMNRLIEAETGFRRSGIVYLCRTQQELAKREAWLDQVGRPFQLDTRLLSRTEIARVLPGLAGPWPGALYTPSDGRAEPAHAAPAIALGSPASGGQILTRCAVRGVETAGGKIAGVVTEHGTIACDQVVLAGGVWSRLFCRPLGLRLPQLKVLSSVMRTEPLAGGPGNIRQRLRLRPAQTARWRLYGGELERQRRRYRPGLVSFHARLPAGFAAAGRRRETAPGQPLFRPNCGSHHGGRWISRHRSRRCVSSTRQCTTHP